MSKLQGFTDEELEIELERRKIHRLIPTQLEVVDDMELRKLLQTIMTEMAEKRMMDDDDEHYIFETVMITYYGKNVFDYINKMCD